MADKKEKLFDQFPPVSTEEWRAKVEADLKGADFNKKLVWRTNEGFNVQPMYRAEDIKDLKTTDSLPGEFPYVRGTRTDNDWAICQEIVVDNVAEANAKALDILGKGITAIDFVISDENVDFAALLAGVDVKKVQVNVRCCPGKAVAVAKAFVACIKAAKAEEEFVGALYFNPFKRQLKHGAQFPKDIKEVAVELLEVVKDVKKLRVLSVDSYLLGNAGAYIYQELGYALA